MTGGAFSVPVDAARVSNQIVVAAVRPTAAPRRSSARCVAFGARVGGVTDPAGDDNGPGSYIYPTDGAFNAGSFDLTGARRLPATATTSGSSPRSPGEINNPWGGNEMSTSASTSTSDAAPTPATPPLPGTNLNTAGPGTGRRRRRPLRHQHVRQGVYGPDLAEDRRRARCRSSSHPADRRHRAGRRARRDRPRHRRLPGVDVRRRRGRRGHRQHPARLRLRLLERQRLPELDQAVPLRRRRGGVGRPPDTTPTRPTRTRST